MNGVDGPLPTGISTEQSGPFGSALSVSEFAALSRAGVAPLGAVMGCDLQSVYVELPTPAPPMRRTGSSSAYGRRYDNDVVEIHELDRLVNDSRQRALTRLRDEASALGADAVIGIRQVESDAAKRIWSGLAASRHERRHLRLRHRRTLDYQLVGTAVRDLTLRAAEPCLTTASATDFCKLRDAGWRPSGIVAGCSHQFGANVRGGVSAAEIAGATALWAGARAKAFEQLETAMGALGADGLIGLDVSDEHAIYERAGGAGASRNWTQALLVTVSMIATAIERVPASETQRSPMRILTLR